MAKVRVLPELAKELRRLFKSRAEEIFELMFSVEQNPQKGKFIANIGQAVVKEIKFESFRFYFVTDGYKLQFCSETELRELIITFVAMSKKNNQQRVIEEIKEMLRKFGLEHYS